MGLFSKLFGKGQRSPEPDRADKVLAELEKDLDVGTTPRRTIAKTRPGGVHISFSRGPKAVSAEPGEEDATFLKEVSVILERPAEEIDFTKAIQADYGCDELEVIEFIQIAEDVWGVSLMPSTFDGADVEKATKEFITLGDIVSASKAQH